MFRGDISNFCYNGLNGDALDVAVDTVFPDQKR